MVEISRCVLHARNCSNSWIHRSFSCESTPAEGSSTASPQPLARARARKGTLRRLTTESSPIWRRVKGQRSPAPRLSPHTLWSLAGGMRSSFIRQYAAHHHHVAPTFTSGSSIHAPIWAT